MSSGGSTNRDYLLGRQYRDAGNLNARIQLHRRFSQNPQPWSRWVFDHLLAALGPDAHILEIGCGPATLWAANLDRLPPSWRVTPTDFSPGMLETARQVIGADAGKAGQFSFVVADAEALPFADESFDAAVANHMLYHVPNRPRALGELRRVLRPGGRLFAATNGRDHLRELDELTAAYTPVPTAQVLAGAIAGFTLENGGEQLAAVFDDVTLDRHEDALVVTEATPLVAYVRSLRPERRPDGEALARFALEVERRIAADGAIRITKNSGLFMARKSS
jgi:SAM-dependent methyltransferase